MMKGLFEHAELFGIFEAAVPNPSIPETTLNQGRLQQLDQFDQVYVCGSVKSHVVAYTLDQLIDCVEAGFDDYTDRYVIIEDAMADLNGYEDFNKNIFEKARGMGFKFMKMKEE